MFFESSRRYNCQIESHREFSSNTTVNSRLFSESSDNYVVLRSQTPIDCHRDDLMSVSISGSMTTRAFSGPPPQPAPRKSLARKNNIIDDYRNNYVSNDGPINKSSMMEERFSLVKLQASKFQRALLENQNNINSSPKLIKNRFKTTTTPHNTLTKYNSGTTTQQHHNIETKNNLKKQIDDWSTSGTRNHQVASGDDDTSTDDTEDSSKPTKPGKLDLRQFDNITTAIGKLNVSTAPPTTSTTTTTTSLSSSLANSTITIKPPNINTTTPNNNARRLQKNPRQNHGRAVAPPKLPPNNDNEKPTNTIPTNEDNSAIDFSQSPIAQRLLKHSKDHKVSELNSPYESDSEQNLNRSFDTQKGIIRNSSIDSSELINSRGAAIRQLNEILANKQPPGWPKQHVGRPNSSDQDQQTTAASTSSSTKKSDKDKDNKKDKKKLRSDEKLEKRKQKEEERLRRQEEEKQKRQEKKLASKKSKSSNSANSTCIGDDGIPLFIRKCIEFIEIEGLDAEGLYRVPGNRAHVDAFVQKFKENPNMSIVESDVPVNAVATALKDFLSKKWGPIIPLNQMNELTELSNISEKEQRIQAVKQLVHMLPVPNYRLLKYVFNHFVNVSLNHSLNSMDSKNLAICWWPTLLPLHFNDMVMFEQMRPHLEESIQTMIDQYEFIFDSEDPSPPTAS